MMFASILIAVALLGPTARGVEPPRLKIGDPAPPLLTGAWVQGEPIAGLEPGKANLVDFWATWCGPCLASVPHLNALHEAFKDRGLVEIGQNVHERNLAKVPTAVRKARMAYLEMSTPPEDLADLDFERLGLSLLKRDSARIVELAARLREAYRENSAWMHSVASMLVATEGLDDRGLAAAEDLAEVASAAASGEDPQCLDTLARVQFLRGRKEKAIATQERAVQCADGPLRAVLEQTLDQYRTGKPRSVIRP